MARKPALGMLLPAQRGTHGYFQQGFNILDQVKSNLTNLVLTKKYERTMQPEFGCDIHDITLTNITPDIEANIRGTIEAAVQIWMPYVKIDKVVAGIDDDANKLIVDIAFSLRNFLNSADTIRLII